MFRSGNMITIGATNYRKFKFQDGQTNEIRREIADITWHMLSLTSSRPSLNNHRHCGRL